MKWNAELAEAIGTFNLVLAGCGAIIVDAHTGALGVVGIALSFGLVVGSMVYAVGHISGAHFNPAVTLAFVATGHFPGRRAARYILAQIIGATLAAAFLLLLPDAGTLGATTPWEPLGNTGAFMIEVLITAALMFVIMAVATDGRAVGNMAGSAIGGAVALGAMWAGPLTGASMNPARSLGPAFMGDGLEIVWLYVLAPVVGALLGAGLYTVSRAEPA